MRPRPVSIDDWERVFRKAGVPGQVPPFLANSLAEAAGLSWRTEVPQSRYDLARLFSWKSRA